MRDESKTVASTMVVKVLQPDNLKVNSRIESVCNNSLSYQMQMNEPKVKMYNAVLEGITTVADKLECLQVTITDKTRNVHIFPLMQVGFLAFAESFATLALECVYCKMKKKIMYLLNFRWFSCF